METPHSVVFVSREFSVLRAKETALWDHQYYVDSFFAGFRKSWHDLEKTALRNPSTCGIWIDGTREQYYSCARGIRGLGRDASGI
jgi:hypothetical protein